MKQYELIAPCHFGMEAVLKREIQNLGYEISQVDNGKVTFFGDAAAIARANIFLRTTERILLKIDSFRATSFDDLFEAVKAIPWADYIPEDGKFWVTKANSVSSKLFSPSDIQKIVKKAMVEKLKQTYHTDWFEETGASYPLRISIVKDIVTIGLDTTGESLHKRGYRKFTAPAPVTETLAAAMILLAPWHADRMLIDPFCGSGTFPIEAAMIAANIAPGMNRKFTAQKWTNIIDKQLLYDAVDEAEDMINLDVETDIQGLDIDADVIRKARSNAENAGVEKLIHFQERSVADLSHHKKYGFIITNPPYGERLEDKETLPGIYSAFGRQFAKLDSWSAYMITSYEDAVFFFGRMLFLFCLFFNGMLKTYFYSFQGPKPPKKEKGQER